MYSGPTGNSIEKSATGIEFLRNSPNTNTGEWGGDVCLVNNNSCNTELGFLFEEELDSNRSER